MHGVWGGLKDWQGASGTYTISGASMAVPSRGESPENDMDFDSQIPSAISRRPSLPTIPRWIPVRLLDAAQPGHHFFCILSLYIFMLLPVFYSCLTIIITPNPIIPGPFILKHCSRDLLTREREELAMSLSKITSMPI